MTEVTIKDELLCRVCLSSQEQKYVSLFEKYKCFRIFEYINTFSNVNIQEFDGLPDKICKICYSNLETAIIFKEKCEQSDVVLKTQIVKRNTTQNSDILIIKLENSEDKIKLETKDDSFEINMCESPPYEEVCGSPSYEEVYIDTDVIENLRESNIENNSSQVQCHDCNVFFKSKCKLRVHWKKVHLPQSLICPICKRTFKSYRAMHVHLKSKKGDCNVAKNKNVTIEGVGRSRIFRCKECNHSTQRLANMASHLRTHSGERPYKCSECPKRFTQLSSLIMHRESIHKKYLLEITCQVCGKIMKGRNRMRRHIKTHYDAKIKCTICNKSIFKQFMSDHMVRHSGIKSVTCEICAASFYTLSELYNHRRRLHFNGELIKCTKCEFKTTKTHALKRHISKHTDDNFPCTICGKFFPMAKRLATHLKGHFEEKQYHCVICGKTFLYRDSLRRHKLEKHQTSNDQLKTADKTDGEN